MVHTERHRIGVGGWLRAAVLGANDGVVSTASLVLGVAAAQASNAAIATAGLAGLVGGALSMAAGEYVSVSSQRDVEQADLARETRELAEQPVQELSELTGLLAAKGLPPEVARQAALAFSEHDALATHAREELGIVVGELARPVQAAVVSALSFAAGATLPLVAMVASPSPLRLAITVSTALLALAGLGGWSARLAGAPAGRAVARVAAGGALAMGLTAAIGYLFGVSAG